MSVATAPVSIGGTNERPADGGRLVYDYYRSLYEEIRRTNQVLDAKMYGVALLSVALAAVAAVIILTSGYYWALPFALLLTAVTFGSFYEGQTRSGKVKSPGTADWSKTWSFYLGATGEDMLLQVVSDLHTSIRSAESINACKWESLSCMFFFLMLQVAGVLLLALLAAW